MVTSDCRVEQNGNILINVIRLMDIEIESNFNKDYGFSKQEIMGQYDALWS